MSDCTPADASRGQDPGTHDAKSSVARATQPENLRAVVHHAAGMQQQPWSSQALMTILKHADQNVLQSGLVSVTSDTVTFASQWHTFKGQSLSWQYIVMHLHARTSKLETNFCWGPEALLSDCTSGMCQKLPITATLRLLGSHDWHSRDAAGPLPHDCSLLLL